MSVDRPEHEFLTIKEYVDRRFDDNHRLYDERYRSEQDAIKAALSAQQTQFSQQVESQRDAVLKSEVATEKRFDSVNEFREVLRAQQTTYITRVEIDLIVKSLRDLIDKNETAIGKLREELSAISGKSQATSQIIGVVIGIGGLVAAVVAVILK